MNFFFENQIKNSKYYYFDMPQKNLTKSVFEPERVRGSNPNMLDVSRLCAVFAWLVSFYFASIKKCIALLLLLMLLLFHSLFMLEDMRISEKQVWKTHWKNTWALHLDLSRLLLYVFFLLAGWSVGWLFIYFSHVHCFSGENGPNNTIIATRRSLVCADSVHWVNFKLNDLLFFLSLRGLAPFL